MNACASWSAVSDSVTAIEIGWISSLARGPTTTPPTTMPVPGRQNNFTKPSLIPCILARGVARQREGHDVGLFASASTAFWDQPTVAISGAVKTLEEPS